MNHLSKLVTAAERLKSLSNHQARLKKRAWKSPAIRTCEWIIVYTFVGEPKRPEFFVGLYSRS
jgi:hypothetical protein